MPCELLDCFFLFLFLLFLLLLFFLGFALSPDHHPRISPSGWNELLIASFSHRSIAIKDGILLATGLHVHRNSAHSAGVGAIFDR